jgi:hypothetical protein
MNKKCLILSKLSTAIATVTLSSAALSGSASAANLVVNGDFSAGNIGFTSEYNYVSPPLNHNSLLQERSYTIATNPNSTHPFWHSFGDRTTGTWNMMVVNGAIHANTVIWQQLVQVTPQTLYNFAAWAASSVLTSPAQLQFMVNNQVIGPVFNASSTPGQWELFNSTWNSGSETTALISIVNLNIAFHGNDFALDDISLEEIHTPDPPNPPDPTDPPNPPDPPKPVPEPLTVAGSVLAGGFLGALKRRRK